jgi:hypothetical protein
MPFIRDQGEKVQGFCPMGCGETLFLGEGGYVTCADSVCPMPDSVSNLLSESPEQGHIGTFHEVGGFTLAHPLRERIGGTLETCALHRHLTSLSGPPVDPGQYRMNLRTGSDGKLVLLVSKIEETGEHRG